MAELGSIIARERKDRTAELNAVHRKLVAQREYYEHQLANKPSEADELATKLEDLSWIESRRRSSMRPSCAGRRSRASPR
jgi:hypothetical protein